MRSDIQKHSNIVQSFMLYTPPDVHSGLTVRSAVTQELPYFIRSLTPNIRTVNFRLLSEREQNELANLIAKMARYNVNYKKEMQVETISSEKVPVYNLFPYVDAIHR
jgi:hypothetical protein